jgi:hypothetical protein
LGPLFGVHWLWQSFPTHDSAFRVFAKCFVNAGSNGFQASLHEKERALLSSIGDVPFSMSFLSRLPRHDLSATLGLSSSTLASQTPFAKLAFMAGVPGKILTLVLTRCLLQWHCQADGKSHAEKTAANVVSSASSCAGFRPQFKSLFCSASWQKTSSHAPSLVVQAEASPKTCFVRAVIAAEQESSVKDWPSNGSCWSTRPTVMSLK